MQKGHSMPCPFLALPGDWNVPYLARAPGCGECPDLYRSEAEVYGFNYVDATLGNRSFKDGDA